MADFANPLRSRKEWATAVIAERLREHSVCPRIPPDSPSASLLLPSFQETGERPVCPRVCPGFVRYYAEPSVTVEKRREKLGVSLGLRIDSVPQLYARYNRGAHPQHRLLRKQADVSGQLFERGFPPEHILESLVNRKFCHTLNNRTTLVTVWSMGVLCSALREAEMGVFRGNEPVLAGRPVGVISPLRSSSLGRGT